MPVVLHPGTPHRCHRYSRPAPLLPPEVPRGLLPQEGRVRVLSHPFARLLRQRPEDVLTLGVIVESPHAGQRDPVGLERVGVEDGKPAALVLAGWYLAGGLGRSGAVIRSLLGNGWLANY